MIRTGGMLQTSNGEFKSYRLQIGDNCHPLQTVCNLTKYRRPFWLILRKPFPGLLYYFSDLFRGSCEGTQFMPGKIMPPSALPLRNKSAAKGFWAGISFINHAWQMSWG
jgi:hypothetical protein